MSPGRSPGRRWLPSLTALVLCAACVAAQHAPFAIKWARRLPAGDPVTVEGFVTVPAGLFASFTGDQGFAIQDATGGIYVSLPSAPNTPVGQGVRVTGRVSRIAQMIAVSTRAEFVAPTSQQRVVEPLVLKTGAVGPATEGRLVRIRGAITGPIGDDRPYGYKLSVDDGSGETRVFVPVSTGIDPLSTSALRVGQVIAVVGFSGRYEDTHEVIPRFPADLSTADARAGGPGGTARQP